MTTLDSIRAELILSREEIMKQFAVVNTEAAILRKEFNQLSTVTETLRKLVLGNGEPAKGIVSRLSRLEWIIGIEVAVMSPLAVAALIGMGAFIWSLLTHQQVITIGPTILPTP